LVATTSFGLQAAVMLHLLHQHAPGVPVVFLDTGYLFPETYRYAEELAARWSLDLRVYQPTMTAARQEALYGRLWEQGEAGLERYAVLNKVEPMNRALRDLGADVWLSGVRRSQSITRSARPLAERQGKTLKVYPILDWPDARVAAYLHDHGLPRHPLEARGYETMGDWHSTLPRSEGETREATRFHGQKYECGLHLESGVQDFQI
jgi:phosphoadenosine phosphosulfate reductase